jgi:hypothetical protein
MPLQPGTEAPPIPGADLGDGARAVLFYKVTCPTCQISAPVAERLRSFVPDRFVAVGQDPPERLREFEREHGASFGTISDEPPYELSDAYGIRTVPTLFVLRNGSVDDLAESWDRDGWNRLAAKLALLTEQTPEAISWEGDGLPPFRPG